jgi:hypothetical protein
MKLFSCILFSWQQIVIFSDTTIMKFQAHMILMYMKKKSIQYNCYMNIRDSKKCFLKISFKNICQVVMISYIIKFRLIMDSLA